MQLSLAEVPRRLRATYGSSPPYFAIHRAVINGQIEATRLRSRWYVAEGDLPAIAAALGLSEKVAG